MPLRALSNCCSIVLRAITLLSVTCIVGSPLADVQDTEQAAELLTVRVVSFNVLQGKRGSPEAIGQVFKQFQPDLMGFSEVPDGDWTERVGKVLGMPYVYVGKISSKHHKDKYKSILSRTPLFETEEFELTTGNGWNPASAVRAKTIINGSSVTFYSLHIARSGAKNGHAYELLTNVLNHDSCDICILSGDFNNEVGHGAITTLQSGGWRDVWSDLPIDIQKETSVVKRSKYGVLDHIFFNGSSQGQATIGGVLDLRQPLSDHKPVFAEIAFPANPVQSESNLAPETIDND